MLKNDIAVQECDARKFNSSNTVEYKIKKARSKIFDLAFKK